MDNGVYIALSRQIGLFNDMAVLANNVANVNTTGYQAEELSFRQYLAKDGNLSPQSKTMAFAQDVETYRDTTPGSFKTTENPLDLAIAGDGYFAVETPLGTRYTRTGNFQIDNTGALVDQSGNPVLDNAGQRIIFEENDRNVLIGEAGNIKVDGAERAVLGVYKFDNPKLLERTNSTLFKAEVTPTIAEKARVNQGVLESSNVQAVREMTHMIDVSRAVNGTAKLIETYYDLQRRTGTTLAQQS